VTSPSGRNPDETNGGVWIRTIGGRLDTQSTGSSGVTVSGPGVAGTAAGNINCNSDIRQDYAGVQVGQDLARLNLNGSGANLHFGVTTGWANTKFQDLSALGGTTGNVEVPFVGMYSALAWGNFFADVLARWDFYQMSLFSPTASLTNQRLDAHGFSISASAGYKIDVGNNWFVEPSASIIHSVTSVDQLNLAYGFGSSNTNIFIPATAVQFSDIDSTLGRAGVRFGTSFTAGNLLVQPFVTVSVWHEFAGNTAATLLGNDFLNQINIAGNVSTTRIGTYGQYSDGAPAQVVG